MHRCLEYNRTSAMRRVGENKMRTYRPVPVSPSPPPHRPRTPGDIHEMPSTELVQKTGPCLLSPKNQECNVGGGECTGLVRPGCSAISAPCLPRWSRDPVLCGLGAAADPMDQSPPGSSVHGILQARILEWVAISSSSYLIEREEDRKSVV